jgi:hypothetical protein
MVGCSDRKLERHEQGKILFDLTADLWNKSVAKDKDEFVGQWEHNLLIFPDQNPELQVIWHYGLDSEIKDGSYKGQEIGEYLKNRTKMCVVKYQPNAIISLPSEPKLVLLPFFRDSTVQLDKELRQISSEKAVERRNSMLYGALSEILKRKI